MNSGSVLREQLVREIEKLSEVRLQEVLDFVEYLLSKEQKSRAVELDGDLDPAKDPILKFIGGVSHGSLAQNIDRELYGE